MPGPDPDPDRDLCPLCGFPIGDGGIGDLCYRCSADQYSDERHEVEPEEDCDE